MRVVLDANVVAAAVGWNGEAYRSFVKLARRQIVVFGTPETLQESSEVASRIIREHGPAHDAMARLNWYLEKIKLGDAVPLGKQRSRDATDDLYIAAALAGQARAVVTYDKDLLVLGKPFGIEMIRPSQLLALVQG